MNWFGQSTTTPSRRHRVEMAWLRIARTFPGRLTASCPAPALCHLHRGDHGLGTAIYASCAGAHTAPLAGPGRWASGA